MVEVNDWADERERKRLSPTFITTAPSAPAAEGNTFATISHFSRYRDARYSPFTDRGGR